MVDDETHRVCVCQLVVDGCSAYPARGFGAGDDCPESLGAGDASLRAHVYLRASQTISRASNEWCSITSLNVPSPRLCRVSIGPHQHS